MSISSELSDYLSQKNVLNSTDQNMKNDVVEVIEKAHEIFLLSWKNTTGRERAILLTQVALHLRENKELFAKTIIDEMGKTMREALAEVEYSAGYFDWFAGEAPRIYGTIIPAAQVGKKLEIVYEPVGVCGVITPWNFPLAMIARKVSAALAAGCTVVAKPSPETPLTCLLLAKLFQLIGIPEGVFSVVIGPEQEIGKALLSSSKIKKISFTGSTAVGKYLYEHSAPTLKKITLELGGHAPFIVCEDADLDKAVTGAIIAKFRNIGQTCIAANRFFVHKNIYNSFVEKLLQRIGALKVGDPYSLETDISNRLHPESQKKVHAQVEDALSKGATPLRLSTKAFEPQVLGHVTPAMTLFYEETFGPVVAIIAFETIEEVISSANDSEYGLAAYLYTESLSVASQITSALQFGIIGVNDGAVSTPEASFGGMKNSGFGREGGPTGIYEYLMEKLISTKF